MKPNSMRRRERTGSRQEGGSSNKYARPIPTEVTRLRMYLSQRLKKGNLGTCEKGALKGGRVAEKGEKMAL